MTSNNYRWETIINLKLTDSPLWSWSQVVWMVSITRCGDKCPSQQSDFPHQHIRTVFLNTRSSRVLGITYLNDFWWNDKLVWSWWRLLSVRLRPDIRANTLFVELCLQMILTVRSSLSAPGLSHEDCSCPAGYWNLSMSDQCWGAVTGITITTMSTCHTEHWNVLFNPDHSSWLRNSLCLIIIIPGYCSSIGMPICISLKFIATISEDVFWWMGFLCSKNIN